jgi:hypothetical protein
VAGVVGIQRDGYAQEVLAEGRQWPVQLTRLVQPAEQVVKGAVLEHHRDHGSPASG